MHSTGLVVCVPQPWHALLFIEIAISPPLGSSSNRLRKDHPPPGCLGRSYHSTSACSAGNSAGPRTQQVVPVPSSVECPATDSYEPAPAKLG